MASLSCRISIRNGVAEVFNEDGTPSELYAEALKETGNQEEALNLWAIAYSQDFVAESPIVGDSARLNDVIKFLDTKDSQRKTLTKEQRLEIKGMMKENNLASLAELQRTLVKVFKPLGIPTFEPGMEVDKLYSPTEQQEVDPEAVSEVMVAIEGELRRGNIIVNPENKSGKSLSDTTKKTPLGTSENISSEQVEQDIIDSIENFQDREEVERIVDNHENYDALDRPASFKYYLARLRRLPIMTFNGVTATEENRRTYNEIITNALPSALAAIRAELFTINKISDNVWNSKKAATKKIISALEKELALHGIDIIGLSKAEVSRPDLVGMLTALQTHLEEGDDIAVERFAEIKDKYITPKPATRVTLVDPAYEGLDIVYSENSYPDSYLFEQEGLIRIGENLYHRVNREDNTISNYAEALYQKVLDGVFAVPTEVDDIQDPNNKEELLKDIINFAAGRNTGLQVNDNVEVSLAQMYFEHNPIVKRDVIGELGHISTDVNYLKDDFISDFYKYVLKEKIKNSYAYRTILSKFSFSEAGISLDYPISTIEDIEYQKELEDYIRLKKDSSMNYLLPSSIPAVTQELRDLNDINSVPSFADQVQRYKEYVVTPSATSNIIKVDGKLYRNVGNGNNMSVFAEVVTPTSVYFDTEGTTEHDQDVVNSIIEKQMFIFAPEKLTTEEFQQKQKENKINTKAPKVDKEALQDEKTAKDLAIKLQGLDDTPTETAQEYVKSKRLGNNPQLIERVDSLLNKTTTKLVSEYLKQKLGMGISILSNTDMRKELAKRGYNSLKAMVQAYHGSPFSFDKFTTSKMGTGEGAQAFGWGLYFTSLEGIAKNYAKQLSRTTFKGTSLDDNPIFEKLFTGLDAENGDFYDWERGTIKNLNNFKKYIKDSYEAMVNESQNIDESHRLVQRMLSDNEYSKSKIESTRESLKTFPNSDSIYKSLLESGLSEIDAKKYTQQFNETKERSRNFLYEAMKYQASRADKLSKIIDFVRNTYKSDINYYKYLLDNFDEFNLSRNLYKVSLHKGKTPDQYTWLEWDKPVSDETKEKFKVLNSNDRKIFNIRKEIEDLDREIESLSSVLVFPQLSREERTTAKEKAKSLGFRFSNVVSFDALSQDIGRLEDAIERLDLLNELFPNDIYTKLIEVIEDKISQLHFSINTSSYSNFYEDTSNILNEYREASLILLKEDISGSDFYKKLSNKLGGDKKASLFLLENGIDGVKYPAESISRGATSDSARGFNYVVFDENAVTIDEKIQFLSANDKVYGFYDGATGEIYLTEDFLNSGALIHEHFHLFKPILKKQAAKGNKDAKVLLDTLKKIVDESGAFSEAEFSARYDAANRQSLEWTENRQGKGDKKILERNQAVQQSAIDLKAGRITNEQHRQNVKDNSPIEPITTFYKAASEAEIKKALASNLVGRVNEPVEEGKMVALRLDIPAYQRHNTWVVTIHGAKTNKSIDGLPISFSNVARITNATFNSRADKALAIATGSGKDSFIRINGNWKNFEGKTIEEKGKEAEALVEEIKDNPEWVQVGTNPFRQSFFYDRANGIPVKTAEEVVQIGGLVYAKNVEYGDLNDPEYTVKGLKDAAGNPVQFFTVSEKATESDAELKTSLQEAKKMLESGETLEEVEKTTGWILSNGQWVYFNQDVLNNTNLLPNVDIQLDQEYNLGEILDITELGKLYPNLKETKIKFFNEQSKYLKSNLERSSGGFYRDGVFYISLNRFASSGTLSTESINQPEGGNITEDVRTWNTSNVGDVGTPLILIHELTHFIQNEEGLPVGGDHYTLYREATKKLDTFNIYDTNKAISELSSELLKGGLDTTTKAMYEAALSIAKDIKNGVLPQNKFYLNLEGEVEARFTELIKKEGLKGLTYTEAKEEFKAQEDISTPTYIVRGSKPQFSTRLSSEAYNPRPGESKKDYLERMREEVEANLLGDNSTEYFQRIAEENNFTAAQTKTFLQRIKAFIGKFSKWIADQLGFKNITPEQAAAMTTKEALDRITTSMLRGDFGALDIKNGIDMFSIIGRIGAQNQADNGDTYSIEMYTLAQELDDINTDLNKIKQLTGWEKGVDSKWRYELDTQNLNVDLSKLNKVSPIKDANFKNPVKVLSYEELIDLPEFYAAYPNLKNGEVVFYNNDTTYDAYEMFNFDNTIYVNETRYNKFTTNESREKIKRDLIHEITHSSQAIEGFAKGGNTADISSRIRSIILDIREGNTDSYQRGGIEEQLLNFALSRLNLENLKKLDQSGIDNVAGRLGDAFYMSLAGEVEARAISDRVGLTKEEKRNTLISANFDTSISNQNVWDRNTTATIPSVEVADIQQKVNEEHTNSVAFMNSVGFKLLIKTDIKKIDNC